MKTKTSKAQLEVWEWKESLYNEIKKVPRGKRIPYLVNKSKKTIDSIMKEKKTVYSKPKRDFGIVADSKK